jgi:hypothetical protein
MEPAVYVVKDCKAGSTSKDSYGEYQNYALSLEHFGEPVKYTLASDKPAPMKGDYIHGIMEEFETNGKTYHKLRAVPRPAADPPTKDELIRSQWAIGQAVQCYLHGEPSPEAYNNIETEAKHFYTMALRIKD